MTGMEPIAACNGVDIYAPTSGKFAFLKSPFAAHTTMSAVDIYPGGDFGDVAPSPVEGTVIDIREYPTPTPFQGRDFAEYLTAIKQGDSVVKILHMKPTVGVGDKLDVGDPIGTLVHNGYFYFWNEPPLHVEVRDKIDYIRASNHNPLMPGFSFSSGDISMDVELRCNVVLSNERFALLKGEYEGDHVKGYMLGGGLLDGLVPFEPWDAIDYFGLIAQSSPVPCMVSAGGRFKISAQYVRASIKPDRPCKALGFTLAFSEPVIKVIPDRYGQKLFEEGDIVTICLSLSKDHEVN